jgi:DNA repair exonuclease SbcCD nuclease subunit
MTTKEPATVHVAHIADCHLRAYQYGSSRRGQAFLDGLLSAIRAAAYEAADYILCSGDLLDSNNPGPLVVMEHLRQVDEELKACHLPMFVSVGNHDNCEPSWLTPYEWSGEEEYAAAGLHFLRPDDKNGGEYTLRSEYLEIPFRLGVSSFKPAAFMREELEYYKDCQKFDAYMWHGEIREFCGYPKEDAICIDDFPQNMASVIAMGDQHIHKYIRRPSDDMIIAYPGSTEMCSESEDENKKLFLYKFTWNDAAEACELTSIESIPFETQPVIRRTLTTEADLDETVQYIKENPNVLAYIRYDRALHETVSRLRDAADPELTCLRLTPMMPDRFNVHTMSREAVKYGPVEFFETNKEDLIHDPEVRRRVEDLCKDLLTSNKEHKVSINKFCNDRLGTTCL